MKLEEVCATAAVCVAVVEAAYVLRMATEDHEGAVNNWSFGAVTCLKKLSPLSLSVENLNFP